jgi:hypothetical protein
VDIATIGGVARRTVDLFWPMVAAPAGFAHGSRRPRFLTLETAQYYMDRIVEPFVSAGAFDGITIPRSRLVSQIIDNLNKAAAVGFPVSEIAARLRAAWSGESSRLRIYDQVQAVALAFRRQCLAENLLDWSLQIETFWHHLLPLLQLRRYLLSGYRHLIVDNTEEDIPAAHDLLRTWLPLVESALVIHDTDGGYRVFLGADPQGGLSLGNLCRERTLLSESWVTTSQVSALATELTAHLGVGGPRSSGDARQAMVLPSDSLRFHPQMLDWVVQQISQLVLEEGYPAREIAVLAPFLSDSLRFSLTERLRKYNIGVRTHRPSRELRDEPAARCLLTLAKLAHPGWRRPPPSSDVAHALTRSIDDLDPVRARLLADIVYRVKDDQPVLTPFHMIGPQTQDRISYLLGGRYDELWRWIREYIEESTGANGEGLDHFLSRLFGEVLSQSGFGFHRDFNAGRVAANLIESVQKFRQGFSPPAPAGHEPATDEQPGGLDRENLALEYVALVERGVVAAQYISSWTVQPEDALLLVPAYTFLMMNEPVTVQFWLDAGSGSWFERLYQPLTHPHVLRRSWPEGHIWTDEDEMRVREEALSRLVLGLCRRCRERIFLAYGELSERGYEQQGPLLQAVQGMLRRRERAVQ